MAPAQERERRTLDRYTLHGVIASGGMASVHFGRLVGAHGFARTVAIKRLHPQFARDPEFSSMLLDEARLAVRIRHPNVVTTLDSVQADDELFVVMEYIAGESLSSLLREAGRRGAQVPQPIGSAIIAGALAGLHAAHEATDEEGAALQIVHRDVSPQNILVGEDGIARVLDFGIARAAVRSQVSRVGQLKGKLSYMAPEQLRGAPLTRRADIYAASVVLWEVLTGRRLFTGECDAEIFGRILEGVVQPPSVYGDVPKALDEVVLRGLDRDPSRRYATALEMAAALEEALPPASPRAVGAWVEATAGTLLEARAKSLAAIETSQRSAAPTPPTPRPAVDDAPSRDVEARLAQPSGSRGRALRTSVTVPTMTRTVEDMARPAASALATPVAAAAPPRLASAQLVRASTLALGASALVLAVALGRSCSVRPGPDAPQDARAGESSLPAASPPAVAAPAASVGAPEVLAEAPAALSAAPEASAASPAPAPDATAPGASASAAAAPEPAARAAAPDRAAGVRAASPARSARPRSRCVPPYYLDANGIRRIKRECL
ncbi:serine/threonine-protein kinase [Sorangium atrum]|uniref:Serine/threonine-protein kinase n=1 Tax=Sorangium atrum TaxID=2995308 RepID=A0ABT5C8Y3_9BACT|nr:serine/threonine-protein kinase [Sorangium aterium]MDC0681621.1 serine/threonine-protein kinase [Sorangium aterium]